MESKTDARETGLAVFALLTDTACAECGAALAKGDFLAKQGEKGLCLECADLDHLVYLPSGDAALTRRSRKYSRLSAEVLHWSRRRKRYERQGLLVEEAALERAEEECALDADQRAERRRVAQRRAEALDQQFVADFSRAVRLRYPRCPEGTDRLVAEHACRKHSGRVGRTAAAKAFDEEAVDLAVIAHVRHVHTDYDDLLLRRVEKREARAAIRPVLDQVLTEWRGQ
jgi:hypothetical protein